MNLSWNDGLVAPLNETKEILPIPVIADVETSLTEYARISDASDIYQEVQLRHPEQQKHRPMRRPMAIFGDLFVTKRTKSVSSDITSNRTPELPPRNRLSVEEQNVTKEKKSLKKKRSIWKLLTKGKKNREVNSASEKRMSYESCQPSPASSLTDLSLLSDDQMDDVFDSNNIPDMDAMPKPTATNLNSSMSIEMKRSTVSLNVLWSHNLSRTHGSNGDISNINLIGANINSEQIHSEIFIEQDSREATFDISLPKNVQKNRTCEVDENGYAVMQPIIRNENKVDLHASYVSAEDVARNAKNLENNYDIVRGPPRRKLSFDSISSSGCSSDGEGPVFESQPEKKQLNDTNSDDEAISMKFNEYSPTKSTNTNQTDVLGNDTELPLDTPLEEIRSAHSNAQCKINIDSNQEILHTSVTQSNETPFTSDAVPKRDSQTINTESSAEQRNIDGIEMAAIKSHTHATDTPQNIILKGGKIIRPSTPFKFRRHSKQRKRRLTTTGSSLTVVAQTENNSRNGPSAEMNEEKEIRNFGTIESTKKSCSIISTDPKEMSTKKSDECAIVTPQNKAVADRKIVRAGTPFKFRRNSKQRKRRLASARSNGSPFTTEIYPQIEASTELNENNTLKGYDTTEFSQYNLRHPSINSFDKNETSAEQPRDNDSNPKINSFSKRIWRTCSELRKMTSSLLSVRRSMFNFS